MTRLTAIEQECQDLLAVILDLMAAGHGHITHKDHMELTGRVRTCLMHLTNKEYGCATGKHSGPCACKDV